MTPPSPPELFVSERPVRSDFARADFVREKTYARRRKITLAVLAVIFLGVAYALVGHHKTDPANIPTIHADAGDYKQKPADPGGIDILHQDVQVYDQLENKNGTPAEVEHLLPPPEKPKDMPPPQPQAAPALRQVATDGEAAPPAPILAAPAPVITPAPHAAPIATVSKSDSIIPSAPVKQIVTTITPVAAPVPPPETVPAVAPTPVTPAPAPEPTIEQIIANTKNPAPASPAPVSSGTYSIQLASVPDQAKAQSLIQDMQKKYATQLNGITLQANRADLGRRGVFYRIQSQTMAEADANRICAALKQQNTGCILVRK